MKNLMKTTIEKEFNLELFKKHFKPDENDGLIHFNIDIGDAIYDDVRYIDINAWSPKTTTARFGFFAKEENGIIRDATIDINKCDTKHMAICRHDTDWITFEKYIITKERHELDCTKICAGSLWQITIDDDERFNNTTCIIMNNSIGSINKNTDEFDLFVLCNANVGVDSDSIYNVMSQIKIHVTEDVIDKIHMTPCDFKLNPADICNIRELQQPYNAANNDINYIDEED